MLRDLLSEDSYREMQVDRIRRRIEKKSLTPEIKRIHAAKKRGVLTPEAVADFAYIFMRNDETGEPIVPAAHHWLWLKLICNLDIKRLLIIATPESAKTTWMIAFTACMVGFWPQSPGIFASISGDVAEERSLAVRTLVESDKWPIVFPDVKPAKGLSWQQKKWSVAPNGQPTPGRVHATVRAYGTGGSVTGSRAKWVLADDILDHENTRTAYQRNDINHWFHSSLNSRVFRNGGMVRIIGNAWHHDDLHARLRRSEGWITCHTKLLSETNDVYATISYPDDWTGEKLGERVAQARLENG